MIVESEIECPRCKNLALHESDFFELSEIMNCYWCGYSEETIYQEKAPREFIPIQHYTINALGSWCIVNTNGITEFGFCRNAEKKDMVIAMFRDLEANNPTFDKERSFITQWDEENKRIINIVGDYRKNPHFQYGDDLVQVE